MLVKITNSAAGLDFVLRFGDELDHTLVRSKVGTGWENFCAPVDDTQPWPPVDEAPAAETIDTEVEGSTEEAEAGADESPPASSDDQSPVVTEKPAKPKRR